MMKIDDIFFWKKNTQEYGTTIWYSKNYILKMENEYHPNKRNTLLEEAGIIEKLNLMNCVSVPRLKSHGTYKGQSYYITERVREAGSMNDVDALFSFLELKGCGVIHGDMGKYEKKFLRKIDNVLFNGNFCILVDYDQAIDDPVVVGLPIDQLSAYLGEKYKTWEIYCGALNRQLKRFNFEKHFINGRLDIRNTTLMKKGISTDSGDGIYYAVDESTVFSSGERGVKDRLPIIEKIGFKGEEVLDLGCNTGEITRYIARNGAKRVDGFEYCKEHALAGQMINHCEGVYNSMISHRDIGKECLTKKYDTILIFSMLHHVENMDFAIEQIISHCNRILFECRLVEDGYAYRSGKWKKTNKWQFDTFDDLIGYFEKIFGFGFSQDYGSADRDRHILEFIRQ